LFLQKFPHRKTAKKVCFLSEEISSFVVCCLNQDIQDARMARIFFSNLIFSHPENPSILTILIQTTFPKKKCEP